MGPQHGLRLREQAGQNRRELGDGLWSRIQTMSQMIRMTPQMMRWAHGLESCLCGGSLHVCINRGKQPSAFNQSGSACLRQSAVTGAGKLTQTDYMPAMTGSLAHQDHWAREDTLLTCLLHALCSSWIKCHLLPVNKQSDLSVRTWSCLILILISCERDALTATVQSVTRIRTRDVPCIMHKVGAEDACQF